jgi:hypothetical protein
MSSSTRTVIAVLAGAFALVSTATAAAATTTTTPSTTTGATTTSTTTAASTTTTSPATDTSPWIKLSAYSGFAGEKVSVAAACFDPPVSPLTAPALRETSAFASNSDGHQPWAFFAETVIRDLPQGSYPVEFHCGGKPVITHFTVLAKHQVPTKPKGAPETGGGGMARR